MKKIINSILLLILAITMGGVYSSCKKSDPLPNNGKPLIRYVRITNPLSKDSLLTQAFQGSQVAIVGENLGATVAIWFNDQKAALTTTYISPTSILVSVPSVIPKVINNKMKLYFANGDSLLYDFKVQVSEPVISNMSCEYVADGGEATINGSYFYEPLTVTFPGGKVGELGVVTDKIIKVKVPAGVSPGSIIIKTNFGATISDFWFRDNRNIFLSSDPYSGWWGQSFVMLAAGVGATDPAVINGNYIRVKKVIGPWSWTEVAGGPGDAMGAISKNIPDEAILKPSDYNLKFELNTIKPYNNNLLKFNIGLDASIDNNNFYEWTPPYDTKGVWQTITIPFEDIAASAKVPLKVSATGYFTRLLFLGGSELDCDMSLDNFRIVPKIIKK